MRSFLENSGSWFGSAGLSAVASLVVAVSVLGGCDDGPGVSTGQTGTNNAGGGGTPAAGGGGAGGTPISGGAGGAGTAGMGAGNAAGAAGATLACEGPNPQGCVTTGCGPGFSCMQTSGVCVSSSCSCQDGTWICTKDCGGGVCVPNNEGGQYAVRFGFQSGQQEVRDFCVAYQFDAAGAPILEPLGLLLSHFTSPEPFSKLTQITRYIALDQRPVAMAFTSDGDCGHPQGILPMPNPAPYQSVFAVPFSGESMVVWAEADAGPSDAPVITPQLRIVNALADGGSVSASAVGGGDVAFGEIPFGTSSGYTDLPSSSLLRVDVFRQDGTKRTLDFASFDTITVRRATIILRGTGDDTKALVCEDTRPDKDPLGGEPVDVFSSGCLLIDAKP